MSYEIRERSLNTASSVFFMTRFYFLQASYLLLWKSSVKFATSIDTSLVTSSNSIVLAQTYIRFKVVESNQDVTSISVAFFLTGEHWLDWDQLDGTISTKSTNPYDLCLIFKTLLNNTFLKKNFVKLNYSSCIYLYIFHECNIVE